MTGFAAAATAAVDALLAASPESATSAGDHRFDHLLPDRSPEGLASTAAALHGARDAVAAVEPAGLEPEDAVDREVLLNGLDSALFRLEQLRPHEWNPLEANPGGALYSLVARDFAPEEERLRSAAARLAAVPGALDQARTSLGPAPRVHLETAVGQFTGTRALVARELAQVTGSEAALSALDEHVDWLRARLAATDGSADADPRLGPERFAAALALSLDLDDGTGPDDVLAAAEANLARVEEEIAEVAGRLGGTGARAVRDVLDRLAAQGEVGDATVVALCRDALEQTTEWVRTAQLLTVLDDPVEVIVMPEVHRGVAVAYCDPPGPLEQRALPTWFAVSPTPADWPAERVRSFYREYNAHMLHDLAVHEASPGHVQQLAHSRRFAGSTPARAVLWSGAFAEGWAVYAEQLMVESGYPGAGDPEGPDALRMQQLKMQLRMTINAVLDVRVHTRGMTEAEAMDLMTRRGHQEEGEAHGKWRRALLTAGQLSTYFVGWTGVSGLVADLRAARPGAGLREVHDELLAHGTPAPRHLRALLLARR
ncbi:uncharacterized protein (DUF885 family) [Motilibacter peucedani]|uniref:Uncharacterized protein (DUF885 family) n=1 Tax=Motilibacter peucedani TaxID=598650 RepID=A0A420XKR8_9ACTN|nr:DUF885 domain-containing protein [Motilibacter peucedani]RKS68623.1 uncharacterized protein (DUF885 family) [Motilibacter peucedani]